MAGLNFLRLEDFLDNKRHSMALQLEPEGVLFTEVSHFDRKYIAVENCNEMYGKNYLCTLFHVLYGVMSS